MYKCRRCGGVKDNLRAAEYQAFFFLVNAVNEASFNGPPVSMKDVHSCNDGGFGIADLIGTDIVEV